MKSHYLDYGVNPECENPDSYGEICVKCGQCGRKFDDGSLWRRSRNEGIIQKHLQAMRKEAKP